MCELFGISAGTVTNVNDYLNSRLGDKQPEYDWASL